jgi:methionyl-tRNA formyltransferase
LRLVFMGTPSFAVPTLGALVEAGHDIALVVTQPDKPKGRGMKLTPPPVKEKASALGLPVYQPEKVKSPGAVDKLNEVAPDAMVVAAFGQILPKTVLDIPDRGCFNVHASILPKYRGAAPINWAIINGEKTTGVTIMKMDAGLDTGDMLLTEVEPIRPDERLEAGTLSGTPQDSEKATYAPMMKKEMGLIDWSKSAVEIERLVRGLNPWPGAYTTLMGATAKVWRAAVRGAGAETVMPGTVIDAGKGGISVACGEGLLIIEEMQPAGGRRMKASEFLAGHPVKKGVRLT